MKFLTVPIRRHFAALLLAAYGSAGIFGYGLHALWHCDHCHDHVADCHGHAHHGGHHSHECPTGPQLADSHDDCSICAFLAQAQSPEAAEAPLLRTAVAPAEPSASELSVPPAVVRLHLARGPPLA